MSVARATTITPGELSAVTPQDGHYRAVYKGKPVFLKRYGYENMARETARRSRVVNALGVGMKYHGITADPLRPGWWVLVYEYVEGAHFCYLNEDLLTMPITRQTKRDVDRALDALSRGSIMAVDAQFILTPEGRAVMIDFDGYDKNSPRAARDENNDYKRRYSRAIYKNLMTRGCQALLGMRHYFTDLAD